MFLTWEDLKCRQASSRYEWFKEITCHMIFNVWTWTERPKLWQVVSWLMHQNVLHTQVLGTWMALYSILVGIQQTFHLLNVLLEMHVFMHSDVRRFGLLDLIKDQYSGLRDHVLDQIKWSTMQGDPERNESGWSFPCNDSQSWHLPSIEHETLRVKKTWINACFEYLGCILNEKLGWGDFCRDVSRDSPHLCHFHHSSMH